MLLFEAIVYLPRHGEQAVSLPRHGHKTMCKVSSNGNYNPTVSNMSHSSSFTYILTNKGGPHCITLPICCTVFASTHEINLAPVKGLVLPGTKSRKPEHMIFSLFIPMTYYLFNPRYDINQVVFSARLKATHNQYRRHVFLHLYRNILRYTLPIYHIQSGYNGEVHLTWLYYGPDPLVTPRFIGGGSSYTTWTSDDLTPYVDASTLLSNNTYKLMEYIRRPKIMADLKAENILAQVPLTVLASKLSIRFLIDICKQHGIAVSRGHSNRAHIQTLVNQHICIGCRNYVCIFRSIKSSVNRVKDFRESHKKEVKKAHTEYVRQWRHAQSFPPKPASLDKVHRLIRGFVEDSDFSRLVEQGCAVCGCLTPCAELTDISCSGIDTGMLYRPEVTRRPRSSMMNPIENIPGPVLATGCNGICSACVNIMRRGKVPKNALANGLWLGDVPEELQGLSWMEKQLIARISTNTCVIRVHASKLYKMKTNVVCRAIPMKKIYDVLPPKREEFEEILAILFIGPAAPTPKEYRRTPLLIRRDKVATALEWLKRNHSDYADLAISYNNLSEYPEDQPPVYVDYHQSYDESSPSESTAVNNVDNEEYTANGQAPFVVHGLTSDQLSDLWETDDRRTIRLKAMRYFSSGGKALGIGKSDTMESLWNNPRLYPSMFPWLFPYGMGGLGNECIPPNLKISDAVRKKTG